MFACLRLIVAAYSICLLPLNVITTKWIWMKLGIRIDVLVWVIRYFLTVESPLGINTDCYAGHAASKARFIILHYICFFFMTRNVKRILSHRLRCSSHTSFIANSQNPINVVLHSHCNLSPASNKIYTLLIYCAWH